MTRPYNRKPQEWSHPLPAANGLLLTLNAWKDDGDLYFSVSIDDGGHTTALSMLEAFETEREAKAWCRGRAQALLTAALAELDAM